MFIRMLSECKGKMESIKGIRNKEQTLWKTVKQNCPSRGGTFFSGGLKALLSLEQLAQMAKG